MFHFIKKIYIVSILALCFPITSFAFLVNDIKVEGIERVKEKTVLSYLPVRIGQDLSKEDEKLALNAVFDSGLFEDVQLFNNEGQLLVRVEERPTVGDINISGNYLVKTKDIEKSMKNQGLEKRKIFKRNILESIELELKKVYHSQGKYGVKINSQITPVDNNLVNIDLKISEGFPAKVVKVNIVGNKAFSDKKLQKMLNTGVPNWWAIFSSKDKYSKPKLQSDLNVLRDFYADRGYLNFEIDSTQVSIAKDKKSLYVNINLFEGQKFFIRNASLAGRRLVAEKDLKALLKPINKGDVFSRKKIQIVSTLIQKRLGQEGYARARVDIITQPIANKPEVDVVFNVELGKKYIVRNIIFEGHSDTQDKVLRREMRQLEGAWYDSSKIERGKIRLERLSYIQSAPYEIIDVSNSDDQVDVIYTITERLTGSIKAGIGYSGSSVFYNFGLSRANIFGSGNDIELDLQQSESTKSASISYTNPYFTYWGVSRTLNAYYRESEVNSSSVSDYILNTLGVGVRFGIPVTEYARFNFGLDINKNDLFDTAGSPQEIRDFLYNQNNCVGACPVGKGDTYISYVPSLGFSYDTRNRSIFATKGMKQSVSIESTLPSSDLKYYKANLASKFYLPLMKESTLVFRNSVSFGESYGDGRKGLPPYEKYYAGGIRSVRGYKTGSLTSGSGTLDSFNSAYGGDLSWTGAVEYVFPPFNKTSNIRLSGFYDFGNVYSDFDSFDEKQLRTSAGVAMNWIVPGIGPLVFSYAKPIEFEKSDRIERFQFSLGGVF